MADKAKLNLYVNRHLAGELRELSRLSLGQIGLCVSAAILQFLETPEQERMRLIRRVSDAEMDGNMEEVVHEAKRSATQAGTSIRQRD